jgi:uncharacterized protein YecT (DUF1311 family)
MNWRNNSSQSHWLFAQRAVLLVSLLISMAHIHAQTQAEMNATAREHFARADADLNKTYQAVLKKLPDAESKQKLKEAQRAWIASRDAEATRAADEVRGGSMAPTLRYETMTELTQQRIKQLKTRLAEKATPGEEGTATPSPLPEPQKSAETNTATEPTAEPSSNVSSGQEDNANKRCDCPPSPDGKFAFLTSDSEDSYINDLIDKKSGKKLQRIDEADMSVFWNVLWAPDSNGFALMTKVVGHPRLQGWDVYFRSGETFRKIELPETDAYSANVVWAPDLKRFAFNLYSRTTYATVAFYQLRNDKWVALHSPVDKALEHTQLAQLARKYSPKNAYRKGDSSPVSDYLQARSWTDANTVILYAYSEGNGGEAAALFTLKFDEAGNWKIVKTHQMSDKEIEKEDAGEDVSGPAQTTNQEGLSADASFREADRQLNEVYNALRARLSPSERDRLKKEQRAWINQRNAAAQAAKGKAQENPTDAADGEVTKMTMARAAELEKRLKKAK